MAEEIKEYRGLKDDLIEKYFFGIEARLHQARSKKEALQIKQEAYDGIDQESIGNLFPFYLRCVIEDMYSKYW